MYDNAGERRIPERAESDDGNLLAVDATLKAKTKERGKRRTLRARGEEKRRGLVVKVQRTQEEYLEKECSQTNPSRSCIMFMHRRKPRDSVFFLFPYIFSHVLSLATK